MRKKIGDEFGYRDFSASNEKMQVMLSYCDGLLLSHVDKLVHYAASKKNMHLV